MSEQDINPLTNTEALLHNVAFQTPDVSGINPLTNTEALLKYIALNGVGQRETLPTPSSSNVGKIYQYAGTTGTYTKGYFYMCVYTEAQEESVTATQTDTTGYSLGTISVDVDDYKALSGYASTTFTWNYVGMPTSIATASYTFTRDATQDGTGTYAWTSGSVTIWTTSQKVAVGDKTYNTSTAETETAETVSSIAARASTGTGYWVLGTNTTEVSPLTYGITMATQPVIGNIFTTTYVPASAGSYSWQRINVQPGSGASTVWGDITGTLSSQTDLNTALSGKASVRTTVTDTTSTTITLANAAAGTDYVYGTLSSLTVSANATSLNETTIQFTANSSSITVTLPNTLDFIGGTPTFTAGKKYCIAIFNNKCIVGGTQ